ncbi:uncharacterized protein C1683.06c-like [Neodiprion lecontei]|uniref:Uncharacterized protein C1683.06c-like n=1 Tax=Neodiprion lecontei TaxID=441921 RepID=A0A6J0BSX1_NEOLC|nr:uncharacterized protein C1683.06c-like [Neodiprion lecontei]
MCKFQTNDNSPDKTFVSLSKSVRIEMATSLGVGIGVALITCLLICGSTADVGNITKVGKLLIDTDAGADDAIAILMALQSQKLYGDANVVGITCVNGNTYVDNVVLNVLKTLKIVDRLDVPVYKGSHQPLLLNDEKTDYFGTDGFGDFEYPDPPSTDLVQEKHAVNAMIDLVKANPGEITLLALGPLTNVAMAIRMYSSFIDELQQLIILGGSSEGVGNVRPGIEYNFAVDPAANYIVLNASMSKPAILLPYETSERAKTTMAFRTSWNATDNPKVWLINSAESVTLNPDSEYWECADGVAAAVALTSGTIVTKSKSLYSNAIHEGSLTAGMVAIDYSNLTQKAPNTNLIQDVDANEFKNMLLTLLN